MWCQHIPGLLKITENMKKQIQNINIFYQGILCNLASKDTPDNTYSFLTIWDEEVDFTATQVIDYEN